MEGIAGRQGVFTAKVEGGHGSQTLPTAIQSYTYWWSSSLILAVTKIYLWAPLVRQIAKGTGIGEEARRTRGIVSEWDNVSPSKNWGSYVKEREGKKRREHK